MPSFCIFYRLYRSVFRTASSPLHLCEYFICERLFPRLPVPFLLLWIRSTSNPSAYHLMDQMLLLWLDSW